MVYFVSMKWRIPFAALKPVLPPDLTEELKAYIEDDESALVCRKATADKPKPLDPGAREVLQYVSTKDIDRDAEILDPAGAVLTEFRKAPQVLWGHDYSMPPIGSDRKIEADGHGIIAVTKYATTAMGEEVWTLRREGHLNTSSVGFIPLKAVENGADGWAKEVGRLAAKWGTDPVSFEKAKRIFTKWLLLEHSDVSVPANINARTVTVGPEQEKAWAEEGARLNELIVKGAIHTPQILAAIEKRAASLTAIDKTTFDCECIECGHKLASEKHCADIKCPECGGQMRRAERPGPGQAATDDGKIYDPQDPPANPVTSVSRILIVEKQSQARVIQVQRADPADLEAATRRCIMQVRGQLG